MEQTCRDKKEASRGADTWRRLIQKTWSSLQGKNKLVDVEVEVDLPKNLLPSTIKKTGKFRKK